MAKKEDLDKQCPICKHERREEIEKHIKDGLLTKKTVGEDLGMTPDAVYEHMANHLGRYAPTLDSPANKAQQRMIDGTSDAERELYAKQDTLFNNFMALTDRFNDLTKTESYDKETVGMLVQLSAEMRRLAMDMAQLKGDLKKQVEITVKQYQELRVMVLSKLCKSCQEKVIAELAKQAEDKEKEKDMPMISPISDYGK